jgi:hypothetical protein
VRAVFAELAEAAPDGIRYAAFKQPDGVSFVHIAFVDAKKNPLDAIKAFKAFTARIDDELRAMLRGVWTFETAPPALLALGRPALDRLLDAPDCVFFPTYMEWRDYGMYRQHAVAAFAKADMAGVLSAMKKRQWTDAAAEGRNARKGARHLDREGGRSRLPLLRARRAARCRHDGARLRRGPRVRLEVTFRGVAVPTMRDPKTHATRTDSSGASASATRRVSSSGAMVRRS